MALYKRGKIYWTRFSHNGRRIQLSTKTSEKQKAELFEKKLIADLWSQEVLGEKPKRTWLEAALRWLQEKEHKESISDDVMHLEWLEPHLMHLTLDRIDRDTIDYIIEKRLAPKIIIDKKGNQKVKVVTNATVNRTLEVLRAILNRAEKEWGWINKAPIVRLLPEDNKRIRWLTHEEARRLISVLPSHLADLAAFSLTTGLRQANVLGLEWSQVNLVKKHALVHADQSKTKRAIPVPLNETAINIIRQQIGKHEKYVFTYKGKKINQCNTKAWRKGLDKAGIENFRWHDLRHTWASWHIQNGTSLHELQQLGGWTSFEMVLRYAHLSSDHLQDAADRLGTKLVHLRNYDTCINE
jgi:integrase